jgi:putative ABC transport system permease protein
MVYRNNTSGISWAGKTDDQRNIYMETTRINYDYFKTLDLKMLQGRSFSKEFPSDLKRAYILNEEALKKTKIENPIGKNFWLYGVKGPIVGIVEDNYFKSLKKGTMPQVYYMFSNIAREGFFGSIFIKIKAANTANFLPETIRHIEHVWNSVNSTAPFEYNFLDETIDSQYKNEQRLGKLFSYFAFLAIFVSCLGLFGLASFVAECRTKEIGIRKALGASVPNIVLLLSIEFIKWILLANIIAWPLAYLAMKRWLGEFVFRTNMGIELFIFAAFIALLIAFFTISYQSIKTALANPVYSLKYE